VCLACCTSHTTVVLKILVRENGNLHTDTEKDRRVVTTVSSQCLECTWSAKNVHTNAAYSDPISIWKENILGP